VYLSILRLPHVSDLWTESYGHVLLVKLALVSVALAWGGLHHVLARPRVERGDHRAMGLLSRSLVGEAAVGMSVLLVAAVLVDSKPPPRPAPAPVQAKAVSLRP
jgi:putative copper resistance protein D